MTVAHQSKTILSDFTDSQVVCHKGGGGGGGGITGGRGAREKCSLIDEYLFGVRSAEIWPNVQVE